MQGVVVLRVECFLVEEMIFEVDLGVCVGFAVVLHEVEVLFLVGLVDAFVVVVVFGHKYPMHTFDVVRIEEEADETLLEVDVGGSWVEGLVESEGVDVNEKWLVNELEVDTDSDVL